MGDIKIFRMDDGSVSELEGSTIPLERSLQSLFEQNLEALLAVRFLASEFSTDSDHGGRMDSIGIDENNCPVIIEYKRATNENVITQGLYYLDWLMSHQKDFEWLVLEELGEEIARAVDWSAPRLVCVAGDFKKYDEHAVKQMNRNIDLIRYRRFGSDLLLIDKIAGMSASDTGSSTTTTSEKSGTGGGQKTVSQYLAESGRELMDLFEAVRTHLLAMGDDVQTKTLARYFAFRRIKNFACVQVQPRGSRLLLHLKVAPDSISLEEGFTRDVREIGHYGTGDLEVIIGSYDDFEKAKPLIERSYEAS